MNIQSNALENGKELGKNKTLQDGCCLLGWQLSSPCGESTLPSTSIEIDGETIKSDQIKGSKLQWFPKQHLKLTTKYSNRLNRTFNEYGVSYGDFTVVPTTRLDEMQADLDVITSEWKKEVTDLTGNYEALLNDHISKNPEIAKLIKRFAITKQEFESRFKLRITKPLAMMPLFEEDAQEIQDQVAETLWQEIAKEASGIYKTSWFKNKQPVNRVTQKIRNPLSRIMNKLVELSFLSEGVIRVWDTLNKLLNELPKAGHIEGHHFTQLTNCLLVIAHEDTLRLHAEGQSQFDYEPEPEPEPEPEVDTSSEIESSSTELSGIQVEHHSDDNIEDLESEMAESAYWGNSASIQSDSGRSSSFEDFGYDW